MISHRRAVIKLLAAATMTGMVGACQRANETLNIWAMGSEGEALPSFVEGFKRDNPHIKLRIQALPWSAAHEKLLTGFAADNLPDIIAIGNTWIPEFAALNALEPLGALMIKNAVNLDGVFQGTRAAVTIDNTVLALPWYVDTRLLFYRKDLLEKAGFATVATNWRDFGVQLQAMKAPHIGLKHPIFLPLDEFEPLVAFCLQMKAEILSHRATRGGFQSSEIRKAFAYYVSLFKQGFAAVATGADVANIYDEFAKGRFGFYISGPWNISEFAKRLPERLKDAWATAPLPGPDGPGASISGGVSLAITRASNKKDQAFALMRYLSSPEQQSNFYTKTGDLPAQVSSWRSSGGKSASLLENTRTLAFYEQLKRAKPPPLAPEWERIATEMRIVSERVVRGLQPLDEALKELDEFADKALAKRRWIIEKNAAHEA